MTLSMILAVGGAGACVLAAVFYLATRGRSSASKAAAASPQLAKEQVKPDAAAVWIAERRSKLEGKLAELQTLQAQLQAAGQWRAEDEERLSRVKAEVADYLSAITNRPEENLHSYRELFHSGPYTTVPFTTGGWSISWGVWMVDAHLELLIRHAASSLKLNTLSGEKLTEEKRFLDEVESKIAAAGFGGEPYFRRFQMENVARTVCRCRLVRFERSPFGLTPEQAVDELRAADSLPDIGEMTERMQGHNKEDFARLFQDYRTAMDRSWRELSGAEKVAILEALERSR